METHPSIPMGKPSGYDSQFANWKMASEIMGVPIKGGDFPSKNCDFPINKGGSIIRSKMVVFHTYVSLPEGNRPLKLTCHFLEPWLASRDRL